MNPAFKLILTVLALLIATRQVAAEEWRGIKPLSSTREDVVRLFGDCSDSGVWCELTVENEDVLIQFSGQDCLNLRPGTVLSVQRELRNATTFEALSLDKKRFKSFDPSIPRNRGYRGFIDEKSGLLLKTFRGQVFQINYIPRKEEWAACPDYYRKPREFVAAFFPHVLYVYSLSCPSNNPVAGQKVVIVADYPSPGLRMSFFWVTTAGRIVEGQGTKKIVLDTTGLAGKVVTVTFELSEASGHSATASCSFDVAPAPKN